ncbi:Lipopolysaccharide heptosyltransferase-1 (EC 2.-.-.-) (plasmid) [Mycetohabitans rhizoxinica HKI 454]|uniref:Lipopolysaccharide heptosyltransferase 1 n=1 Tax=Mycetohabitans rhizoxinica (strain DSM 19002 / CIP 109453 / HKI 454) TaxID=882378 RepID=E5AUX8_MYCRK|nr:MULTISPECIES: lipopolysaccharide heptosyltransferase I [Mycetohabitans]MCG1048376.1 lipopolysaccharide heptosyltransferase I [Mycetohabitans sp. B6]CBW76902.1 Lipopolysaccharide heptosyltransferase-1 (EC 2.-.-.-) [Mycetohabitans rhizoxinica HKI 454]
MKRILVVKVTSLGDIVQAQPVVWDLRRAFPEARIDWAADEAFADVVRWNPGVDRVLCAPLRRFKKARNLDDLRAIIASIRMLRSERYDLVLDIHGVYKSAIIAFIARSRRRYGYCRENLGEAGAAFAYTDRFDRRHSLNAWYAMRRSVGDALGYSVEGRPHFGLKLPPALPLSAIGDSGRRAMLFHATSTDVKKWPVGHWIDVARALAARGLQVLLPWGSEREHDEACRIAAGVPQAQVLPKLTVTECAQFIEASELVVGMDTGFVHLAYALDKPTVMIFTATSRSHFGIDIPGRATSVGDEGSPPAVRDVLAAIDSVYPRGVVSTISTGSRVESIVAVKSCPVIIPFRHEAA